jgi:hypothetical protein
MSEKLWDVFVSYKRDPDEGVALDLLAALERVGLKCWFAPRDVRSTSQKMIESGITIDGGWDDAIPYAIENSRMMVIVVSKAAMESKQIQKEIYLGDDAGVQFFPVLIEDVPLERSFKYHLGRAQWINCFKWEGSQRFLNVASEMSSSLGVSSLVEAVVPQSKSSLVSCPAEPTANANPSQAAHRSKMRFPHVDGSVVFLEHRQVWVGYAEGRIVCTKNTVEKVMDFLREKFGLQGTIVANGSAADEQS